MNALAPVRRVANAAGAAWRALAAKPDAGRVLSPRTHDFNQVFATDLTPPLARAILQAAAYGRPDQQDKLFDEMLEKDEHLRHASRTRMVALRGLEFEIMSAAQVGRAGSVNEKQADAAADYCRDVIAGIEGFGGALVHMLQAIGRGTAVAQMIWDRNVPIAAEPVEFKRLLEDRREPWRLRIADAGDELAIDEFEPGQFLVHRPEVIGGSHFRGGLFRASVVGHMLKRLDLRAWGRGVEAFGLPIAVGHYSSSPTKTEKDEILRMLRDLGVARGGVFPQGAEITLVEMQNRGQWPHERMINWINAGYSKLWLGQTLTTEIGETGGAMAAATVHNDVRQDIRDDDIRAESETIREQLLKPLVRYEFGDTAARSTPYFRRVVEEARDLKETAEMVAIAVNELGVQVPQAFVVNELGVPVVEGTDVQAAIPGKKPALVRSPVQDATAAVRAGVRITQAEMRRLLGLTDEADEGAAVRFNDQDILQYHVESDVLLINEIRAALGLQAVEWGDRTPLQRRVELGVERIEGRRTDEEKEPGDVEDGDAGRGRREA